MEDKNLKVLELEDGNSYIIFGEVNINNIDYACLINENNSKDLIFQRISYSNNPPKLFPIETDEEFNAVLNAFGERYKDIFEQ